MNKVKCCICGAEIAEHEAIKINTGRVQYMCLGCYKKGTGSAKGYRESGRDKARRKGRF